MQLHLLRCKQTRTGVAWPGWVPALRTEETDSPPWPFPAGEEGAGRAWRRVRGLRGHTGQRGPFSGEERGVGLTSRGRWLVKPGRTDSGAWTAGAPPLPAGGLVKRSVCVRGIPARAPGTWHPGHSGGPGQGGGRREMFLVQGPPPSSYRSEGDLPRSGGGVGSGSCGRGGRDSHC